MFRSFIRRKLYFIAKQFNEVSGSVKIDPECYVSGSMISGECVIKEGCKIHQSHVEGKIEIGRFTSLWGPNISVVGRVHGVQIGSFCSIARNVSIQEDYHNSERLSTYYMEQNIFDILPKENCIISKGKIVIGNDVWIGTGAIVLSGVHVGDGAIVAAGAVVTKNVPSFAVVAGNPAQTIRHRFSADKMEEIKKMQWWNWTIEEIKNQREVFLRNFDGSH